MAREKRESNFNVRITTMFDNESIAALAVVKNYIDTWSTSAAVRKAVKEYARKIERERRLSRNPDMFC